MSVLPLIDLVRDDFAKTTLRGTSWPVRIALVGARVLGAAVVRGDCREVLRGLPDASIDSVVTDPPYGLSKEPDMAEVLTHWLAGDDAKIGKGRGFMGKSWDSFVPGPATWREVYRVLKPGGHALVFAGTRTHGLMEISLRLAGFEIRDSINWAYGSGFPKSLNLGGGFGTALKPAHEPIIVCRKPFEGKDTNTSNFAKHGTGGLNIDGCRVASPGEHIEQHGRTAEASAASCVYSSDLRSLEQGQSEGQKLGRWPANLLLCHSADCVRTGTAKVKGIPSTNVIGNTARGDSYHGFGSTLTTNGFGDAEGNETVETWDCTDDCPIRHLDAQGSAMGSHGAGRARDVIAGDEYAATSFDMGGPRPMGRYGDNGGVSRFFNRFAYGPEDYDADGLPYDAPFLYQAKAGRSERELGCEALPARTGAEAVERKEGSAGTANPRAGAGRTAKQVRNHHPTVKPVALMRWCVRLVTPPGGVVLDPFTGSGTTGVAAIAEGVSALLIELDEDGTYVPIINARTAHARRTRKP